MAGDVVWKGSVTRRIDQISLYIEHLQTESSPSIQGGRVESRPEKVGGGCRLATPALDPGRDDGRVGAALGHHHTDRHHEHT
jgi:hypothetical protein